MDIKVGTRTFNLQVGRLSNAAHTSQHLVMDGLTICGKEPIVVEDARPIYEGGKALTDCYSCLKSARMRRIPTALA